MQESRTGRMCVRRTEALLLGNQAANRKRMATKQHMETEWRIGAKQHIGTKQEEGKDHAGIAKKDRRSAAS